MKTLGRPFVFVVWSVVLAVSLSGCTSAQLRRSTVEHSMTLSEIYTQQVLNNMAMFVENPDALPFFAFPNQGTTAVNDSGDISGPGFIAAQFNMNAFGINAGRQNNENWLLTPISDPAKLGLMRCAYQQAIEPCIGEACSTCSQCLSCEDLRRKFYGSEDSDKWKVPCLDSQCCWFRYGCKKHVPKHCLRPYVGSYGDVYVWVPPEGRDMLTQLTLTILNYATNDAVQFKERTKSVEYWIDKNGQIVCGDAANKCVKVTATIPVGVPANKLAALERLTRASKVREFGKNYGYGAAEKLSDRARDEVIPALVKDGLCRKNNDKDDTAVFCNKDGNPLLKGKNTPITVHDGEFWSVFGSRPEWGDLQSAAMFLGKYGLCPDDIPNASLVEELIKTQTGSASFGLQQLNMQLKASEGSAK